MIEGQVAAIINARELAINRGTDHGVTVGMKFEVFDEEGLPITDPESGKRIGSVNTIKIRVQVHTVEGKFSIAQTYETVGGTGVTLSQILNVQPPRFRTLRTSEAIADPLTEAESYVKRGDRVRQMEEPFGSGSAQARIVEPRTRDLQK
jgi:hypothetical protein